MAIRQSNVNLGDYAVGLAEYSEIVETAHDFFSEHYQPAVDAYTDGEISETDMEQRMNEMLDLLENIHEKRIELNSYRVKTPSLETIDQIPEESQDIDTDLAENFMDEGFEIINRKTSHRYTEAFSDAEIAYQIFEDIRGETTAYDDLTRIEEFDAILEELEESGEELRDQAMKYEERLLDESLGKTIAALSLEQMDPEERERLNSSIGRVM